MKKIILHRILPALLTALLLSLGALAPASALTPSYNTSGAYRAGPYYEYLTSLKLTGDQRTDLILVALSQLGYHEGDSDAEMHGLNTNGSRNFVEYNRLYGKVDNGEGNGVSYGYHWCCAFATWCARQAGIPTSIVPGEISCWRIIDNHFKKMGIWHAASEGYVPLPGDYIFFRSNSAPAASPADHIGIVLYVEGQTVHTVEGNSIYHNVATRSYRLTDPKIAGFASPDYTANPDVAMDFNPATGGYRLRDANYFVTATSLNVRDGAGAEYESLGLLPNGATVVLLETRGNWGRIHYEGETGWVSLNYLQYVPTPVTDLPPTCSVTFEAGSETVKTVVVEAGESLVAPALPERASTEPEKYTWQPLGWDADGDNRADVAAGARYTPESDVTLSAVYERASTTYTIRFFGADGQLISEQLCAYGKAPTVPDASAFAPEDGSTFSGWDSVLMTVTEDKDYHAVFTPAPTYTIRFLGKNGDVALEVTCREGEMPVPPDAQLMQYDDASVFKGWDRTILPATANVDYIGIYEERLLPDDPPDEDPDTPPLPDGDGGATDTVLAVLICGGALLLLGALALAVSSIRRRAD